MEVRKSEIVVASGFLAVATTLFIIAFSFYGDARILPLLVGGVLVGLLTLNLVFEVVAARRRGTGRLNRTNPLNEGNPAQTLDDNADSIGPDQPGQASDHQSSDGMRLRSVIAWIAVLCVLFYFLGMIWAAILFTAAFMRFANGQSILRIIITVASLLATMYVLSEFLLVRIYDGWLFMEDILPSTLLFF